MYNWMKAALCAALVLALLGFAIVGALSMAGFIGDVLRVEPRHD